MQFLQVVFHGFAADSGDLATVELDGKVGQVRILVVENAKIRGRVEEAFQDAETSLGMRLL